MMPLLALPFFRLLIVVPLQLQMAMPVAAGAGELKTMWLMRLNGVKTHVEHTTSELELDALVKMRQEIVSPLQLDCFVEVEDSPSGKSPPLVGAIQLELKSLKLAGNGDDPLLYEITDLMEIGPGRLSNPHSWKKTKEKMIVDAFTKLRTAAAVYEDCDSQDLAMLGVLTDNLEWAMLMETAKDPQEAATNKEAIEERFTEEAKERREALVKERIRRRKELGEHLERMESQKSHSSDKELEKEYGRQIEKMKEMVDISSPMYTQLFYLVHFK